MPNAPAVIEVVAAAPPVPAEPDSRASETAATAASAPASSHAEGDGASAVTAVPEPAVIPEAVRTLIGQVARDVDADTRASVVGALARSQTATAEERVRLVQEMFPMLSSSQLAQTAEMLMDLPVEIIHHMICQLPMEDVIRAEQAIKKGRKG
jgi:hypothetical protein